MDQFKNMIPPKTAVTRSGKETSMDAANLVPGDLITIKGGDAIPADVILLNCNEMKVNNASLTGESEDLLRQAELKDQNIFESPNVAFFGTLCTGGKGVGIVFRTGDETVIGRIANLSQSAEKKQTPLSSEIDRFIYIITTVAFVLGVSFFVFGLYSGFSVIKNLVFAIGIIVANVPEGLLATVTVSLALTAKRMHGKMVLVKNMESVETLGSTSCICSDKTGTLTQNRMTVSQIFYNRKVIDASVNYQVYKELYAKEVAKGKDGDVQKVKVPEYSQDDSMFMTLVKTVALSTNSFFSFSATDDEVRAAYIKDRNLKESEIPTVVAEQTPQQQEALRAFKSTMEAKENERYYIKRQVMGDASETGLVKFTMPILLKKYGGDYD
jgi:sodium/potassium-transporting ATPase subunit alpha